MVRDMQDSSETSLERRWVELLRNVTARQSAKELPFSSPTLDDIHEGLVAVGLRPRCSLLNALLDSMSFQLACIEKQAVEGSVKEKAPSHDKFPGTGSDVTSSRMMKLPLEHPGVTALSLKLNTINVTPKSDTKGKGSNMQDTTDDESDSLCSPQLFPYKNRARTVTVQRPQESRLTSSPTLGKTIPKNIVEEGQSPTPEKHVFMNVTLPSESKQTEKKTVRRQLNLDCPVVQKQQDRSTEDSEVMILDETNFRDNTTFLENSTVTLDVPTPPPPTRLPTRKQQQLNNSLDATGTVEPKPSSSSFGITAKKKKDTWFNQDLQNQRVSASSSNKSNKRPSSSQTKNKQHKQQTLLAMARNFPKKKVDVSTLEEFNGGSRTQSQTSQTSLFGDGVAGGSGVKRKSDESDSTNTAKRDKSYYSETFFISPIKLSPPRPMSASSPLPGPSKQSATASSPKKPLSPIGQSISNRINKVGADNEPKPGGSKSKEEFNSTNDIFKDYDKVPESPVSKFKYKQPTVRKKDERAKMPGWDCDQCKGYYALLESQMDELEIARIRDKCSRHRSKVPVVSCTPENFWCTPILSTEELYREGYIREGTPFTPPPRRKRRSSDDEDEESENRDA